MKTAPPLITWWIFWIALLSGLPFFYTILGKPASASNSSVLPFGTFVILVAGVSATTVIIRWAVIPRLQNPFVVFQMFVAGIAMGESLTFFGIFLSPAHKELAVAMSAATMFQFIPLFAGKYANRSGA